MASPFPKLAIAIPGYTDVSGHTEYIIKTTVGENEPVTCAVQHRFSNFIEVRRTPCSQASLPRRAPPAACGKRHAIRRCERASALQDVQLWD